MSEGFVKKWLIAVRAPFFTASLVPVLVGVTLAYNQTGKFYFWRFILTLLGVVCFNAGTNLANDYYDHKTTDDDINPSPTPFTGGSRVIQNGLISPKSMLLGSFLCFGIGSAIGLYLNAITPGNLVLLLGIIGVLSGFFYTASPIGIVYRGWGELTVGLNLGVLAVLGTYYVQTHSLSWVALWASLPISFLVAAILYINEFQDYQPDKTANKKHLVVRLGRKNAVYGYYFLIVGTYLVILGSIIFKVITPFAFLSFLTIPLAVTAIRVLKANYDKIVELIPANATTVKIHLLVGLLLSLGFVLGKII
ncbi:MAG: 1,4-dihydroxy-2-naphthoate octaprenyltransferase [candidate division Zixibacteria bacterium]|nr:1,4-dihydroxy-2-naphthoate octaprenyltransferase [candidate division Zixibacteria bacterium]